MIRKTVGCMIAALVIALTFGGIDAGREASAAEADFYKGKVLDWIVPYSTGGGYDSWARLLSPFLGKYTGATVVIKNMPGAGSLVGTNQLYIADPNGLTIGILNGPGIMQAQLTGVKGVKFELMKFTWLGRLAAEQRVMGVGKTAPYKTIADLRKSTKPVRFGAPGLGSSTFMDAALLGEALGIKVDLITGYDVSSEVDLAVIRGDLDATIGSFSSKIDLVKNGDMIAVTHFGNVQEADLAKIPNAADLPDLNADDKALIELDVALGEVGRPVAAPPGLNPERAKFLEEAIKKSLDDPEFAAIAKKQQMGIIYLSADQLKKEVEKGVNLSPALKKRFVEIMAKYQPKK